MTTTPLTPTPTTTAAELYRAAIIPRFIDVPTMTFLMLDGAGDPNTAPAYGDAISALYSLAYGLKFALRTTMGITACRRSRAYGGPTT